MATGRSHPSLVMDVQVLVTHAASVAAMEREMGHPPRLIRAPDVYYLFQVRDAARLPGVVERWASYGIAAHVVQIPPWGTVDPRPSSHPMILPSTGRP
jgi:peptidoglycan/xylan/chitin deacetylase (PgdA/CDA1 family)